MTATRRDCSRARSATASRASSPSTPTRKSTRTARADGHRQLPLHGRDRRGPRVPLPRPRALLPAQVRPPCARGPRGRLPLEKTGRVREREADRALRDLRQPGPPGLQLAAPALLPQLHRLADRLRAGEVRLRVRRRPPLLLRPRTAPRRRRSRLDARRDHRGRHPAAPGGRGVGAEFQKPARRTSALAISAAAIISRTEGTRTSATTSWIFGAARAAASSTVAPLVAPQRRGLAAELIGERSAQPPRALDRGAERRQLAAGHPLAQAGEGDRERFAAIELAARPSAARRRGGPARAGDLGESRGGAAPRRRPDREQVQCVGQ